MTEKYKFQIGDRVEITTDNLEYLGIPKGTKGTIIEDYSHEPWVKWDTCERYPDDKVWTAEEGELELVEGRGVGVFEKTRKYIKNCDSTELNIAESIRQYRISDEELDEAERIISELETKATAYDNAKEDLELAQAVRLAFGEHSTFLALDSVIVGSLKELVSWYREQKESENE